ILSSGGGSTMPTESEFDILTEDDKKSFAYGLCVLGHVAVGATMGSLAGGQTILGAAGGGVWGLLTCRYLQEPIKRKLFSKTDRLSDHEFKQVLFAAKRQFPNIKKAEALQLIASARVDCGTQSFEISEILRAAGGFQHFLDLVAE